MANLDPEPGSIGPDSLDPEPGSIGPDFVSIPEILGVLRTRSGPGPAGLELKKKLLLPLIPALYGEDSILEDVYDEIDGELF